MRGGKRIGAGRKSICSENKKVQLGIYIEQKVIDKLGKDIIRKICESAINDYLSKL